MALTPLNLIDDAKAQAFPYLRDENVSPGALLRQLTSLDREIVGMFATHAPERLSVQAADAAIVFATNATGYALSAAKVYTDFKYVDKDGEISNIQIAPEGKQPSKHPAARVLGSTFYPIDPLDRAWAASFGDRVFYVGNGDEVQYRYIAEPARVTTMAQTLASPDEAESYIRESLVLSILLSSGYEMDMPSVGASRPMNRLALQMQAVMMARQNLLHEMTKRTGVSARFGE